MNAAAPTILGRLQFNAFLAVVWVPQPKRHQVEHRHHLTLRVVAHRVGNPRKVTNICVPTDCSLTKKLSLAGNTETAQAGQIIGQARASRMS
jgi:hypothetical protein